MAESVIELPSGERIKNPGTNIIMDMFDWDIDRWNDGPNGEAIIKYDNDLNDQMIVKQTSGGRYFLMCNWRCPIDRSNTGSTIVDECGGNPFPIDPQYTVLKNIAISVTVEYLKNGNELDKCEWADYNDMNVEWDDYE